jgi:translation initiation factor 3 subunit G
MSKDEKKWGDQDVDDEERSDDGQADDVKIISEGPDSNGIRTETIYKTQGKERIKITKRYKVTKKKVIKNKNVLERSKWKKFGSVADQPRGIEANVTYFDAPITFILKPRKSKEEVVETDPLKGLESMVCKYCKEKGTHFAIKCPKRNLISVDGIPDGAPVRPIAAREAPAAPTPGKYVPPARRGVAGRPLGGKGFDRDDPTIRVTNISEETTEDDLRELVRRYGQTTRVFLAKDRLSQVSRGFAFISFAKKEQAQAAIDALNGHGYGNLILHVEFAKPRDGEKDEAPAARPRIPSRR